MVPARPRRGGAASDACKTSAEDVRARVMPRKPVAHGTCRSGLTGNYASFASQDRATSSSWSDRGETTLRRQRGLGREMLAVQFQIAIDDLGAEYANIEGVAKLGMGNILTNSGMAVVAEVKHRPSAIPPSRAICSWPCEFHPQCWLDVVPRGSLVRCARRIASVSPREEAPGHRVEQNRQSTSQTLGSTLVGVIRKRKNARCPMPSGRAILRMPV